MTQLFQPPLPPASESELLSRAQSLAGATSVSWRAVPVFRCRRICAVIKAGVGMLLEYWLGADAGSKAEQDFTHLGVELK
ncbi:DNA mismatch repair protein MutH, partial [Morganella morganii]